MRTKDEFVKLIKEHEGVIFKITTVYTDNRVDQQDLYQDIVYQLWKYFDSFRNESKFSTWMYRVALNTAITRIKKEKRRGKNVEIDQINSIETAAPNPLLEERLKLMYAQIRKLNDLDKGLVLLLLEGKSYQEIAEISGISASNVGTRLSRIKQKLKSNISKTIH
ncbi:RNA polymerase sigma factor [Ascidiimonas sp. W6]|uniref:RNA polymerase sigma factor n=1 Tax=Ascidiimonas meishanensis TaxID=3128903 RepID=UPI0030ECDDA9